MTEKDLKKLNRQELLEVLLAQSKKIDRLQRQLNEANEKLNERELRISEAGSIAEASLVLNNIFADAQKAADQYLENIRLMHERAKAEYEKGELETIGADNAYEESAAFEAAELTEECGVEAAEAVALTEESALEAAEPVELTEESTDEASDIAEERAIEAERVAEKVWADRLAAAEAKAAAEADRKSAEEYLEEIRRMKEQTESECAEKKRRTDKQIRMSLIRTKKAVGQMMTLYADEVTRRLKRLREWDRQMEALHERKIEKRSSASE